jgi:hypothetical protein
MHNAARGEQCHGAQTYRWKRGNGGTPEGLTLQI